MSVAAPTAYDAFDLLGGVDNRYGSTGTGECSAFSPLSQVPTSDGSVVWYQVAVPVGWLASVRERLAVIRRMPDDWDHAGGAAPEPAAVDEAAMLLERLATVPGVPKPLVEANRAGAVQMLWESADRQRSFEVEVPGDGTVGWYFLDRAARREEEREDEDLGGCLSGFTPLILKATA